MSRTHTSATASQTFERLMVPAISRATSLVHGRRVLVKLGDGCCLHQAQLARRQRIHGGG